MFRMQYRDGGTGVTGSHRCVSPVSTLLLPGSPVLLHFASAFITSLSLKIVVTGRSLKILRLDFKLFYVKYKFLLVHTELCEADVPKAFELHALTCIADAL